jgi:L-fucose isomerase-like protein
MQRVIACPGELTVGCEDTEFCRNTLSVRVPDVRRFVQEAEGNHHALVFGDWMGELKELCAVLECEFKSQSW